MKIIWAIDPFVEEKSLQRGAAWALRALTEVHSATIEPVHVFGPSLLDVPDRRFPFTISQVEGAAREALEETLGEASLPALQPLRVLKSPDPVLRHQADTLIRHARESGADLIVVSTKARHGLDRWMLGSFAETLLHRSDVPVLVVNPTWDKTADLRQILFPTDFSDESRVALDEVAEFARNVGGRVILYHRLQMHGIPNIDILLSATMTATSYFQEELSLKQAELAHWAEELEQKGVEVECLLDTDTTVGVPEAILNLALERGVSLIALAAHSGAIRGLLGSTTRKVVRAANTLVWVVYPDAQGRVEAHHTIRHRDTGQPSAGHAY